VELKEVREWEELEEGYKKVGVLILILIYSKVVMHD
jgi:hypothetical protein